MTPPDVITKTSELSNSAAGGYVSVDPATTRHTKFPNIFALAAETPILVANLLDVMKGGSGTVAKVSARTHLSAF
ncbi:unnamed protein product [Dibothriocephalus latus]|uniref:Uncharacterized protein n=1 Tax=Dibothriocephalus latus TaxID=60516 RepID=A0A3P7NNT5_DIBLA|nr:unnamed protein product [Dibothriocephalus latus]